MLDQRLQSGVVSRNDREIRWRILFQDDLERIYTEELRARGHHPRPGSPVSELGRTFHQLVRARLEHLRGKKLRILYSQEMKSHRRLAAVAEVARRARRGEPLWPYLSKHTRKASFEDDLLNHWGIVHFHLGEDFDNTGHVTRTGDLLYAWITDEKIYLLDIRNHAFADERLLNVVVRNWPQLLEPFRLRGGVAQGSAGVPEIVKGDRMKRFSRTVLVHRARSMSVGETTALRDAGVTPTFLAETGARYSPPGGGASCAGTGVHARIRADYEGSWAERIAQVIASELPQLLDHIERTRGPNYDALEFHVEDLEALRSASVVERNAKVRFNFPMEFDRDLDPAKVLAPLIAAATARQ